MQCNDYAAEFEWAYLQSSQLKARVWVWTTICAVSSIAANDETSFEHIQLCLEW